MPDSLPTKLKTLMDQRGFSSRRLSSAAGLNATAVRDILNGKSKEPRMITMVRIAKALNVHIEELCTEQDRQRFRAEAAASGHKSPTELAIELHRDLTGTDPIEGIYDVIVPGWRGTRLRGANLTGANLAGADCRYADFHGAILTRTDFSNADLRGADLSGAIVDGAIFKGANLEGANLEGVDMQKAIFGSGQAGDVPQV